MALASQLDGQIAKPSRLTSAGWSDAVLSKEGMSAFDPLRTFCMGTISSEWLAFY
jgi:hypothetical protein